MKTMLFGVVAWVLASSAASAEVHVTMQNGRYTNVAHSAHGVLGSDGKILIRNQVYR